jgi:formyltetrahydrofolate deformylase
MGERAILLVHSPDRKGLVASITGFIFERGGNIVRLDQYSDSAQRKFFMRAEWELEGFTLGRRALAEALPGLAKKLGVGYHLFFTSERLRMAILASREDHCLFDLLLRRRSGELNVDIPAVISNHDDLRDVARMFDVPFHCLPAGTDAAAQERKMLAVLKREKIDVVVLARYMRILSPAFVRKYPWRIINVHHSFLPAFSGAKPYHQAYARGVKVIGATSHFVTAELDAGPIIEQETIKISHEDSVADLVMKGRDLERKVLAQAVQLYIQHRLFVDGLRTIIL